MSLARVLRLAVSCAGPGGLTGVPPCLQPALVAALQNQFLQPTQPSRWHQERGFAAGGEGGSSGSKPAAAGQQAESEPEHAAAKTAADSKQPENAAAKAAAEDPAADEASVKAEASTGSTSSSSSSSGGGSDDGDSSAASSGQQPPSLGELHPELKKYIQQLKELKGERQVAASLCVSAPVGRWGMSAPHTCVLPGRVLLLACCW